MKYIALHVHHTDPHGVLLVRPGPLVLVREGIVDHTALDHAKRVLCGVPGVAGGVLADLTIGVDDAITLKLQMSSGAGAAWSQVYGADTVPALQRLRWPRTAPLATVIAWAVGQVLLKKGIIESLTVQ